MQSDECGVDAGLQRRAHSSTRNTMTIDEAKPTSDALSDGHPLVTHHSELVTRLVGQCAYLIDEATALAGLIDLVPEDVLTARPLGRWSVKQTLGYLHDMDTQVFLPRLVAAMDGADDGEVEPRVEEVDPDAFVEAGSWNDEAVGVLLAGLRRARGRLVERLQALPEEAWTRTVRLPDGERQSVYDLALHIARHDREHLSAVAYRLHEARLGSQE